jgi:UDP-N-acetylglucosamine--N-acetylmuramyl-(pentapeptide) pyrophosphoryl-undecaprenol N-acetylglucosamine transferase
VRVLIAGGGTGGHLYPGIAVARELQRRDPTTQIAFVGTSRGIEARVVPKEGFPLDLIRVAGLKGMSWANRLRGAALLPLAGVDAWRILSTRRPDVVAGVGGFASGPVVLLAALRGYPTMLLEQNAVPGLTNRLLARWVGAAAVNFEEALPYFPRTGFLAGNPVRPEFFQREDDEPTRTPRDAAQVLIVGGSQGAHAINMAMVEAAPRLAAYAGGLAVTHQTGERDLERVRVGYRRAGLEARVEPFLFAMDHEMKAADLVICRAGATTLAELTAAGRPSILVPLPTAADDHQRKNAEVLAAAGAAEVLPQSAMTGDALADRILALASDGERRRAMSAAARTLVRPDAARAIVDRALALVSDASEERR